MLTTETIEKYIEYTINSGESQVRGELEWLLENLHNPKEIVTGVNEVVDGQEL